MKDINSTRHHIRPGSLLGALAAAAAIAAVAVVPAALAAKPAAKPAAPATKPATPKANGQDYLLPNGNVYQLAKGSYHLVPDMPTALAMGIPWNKLGLRTTVSPIGTPIASVLHSVTTAPQPMRAPSVMANGKDYILPNGNVYQLANGVYRQIPDLATAGAMGIEWKKLLTRSSVSPIGKPLPSVFVTPPVTCKKTTAGLVPSNGKDFILPGGNVYQLANGSFHLVPNTETANAMGIGWNKLLSRTSIGPIGTPVPNVCGASTPAAPAKVATKPAAPVTRTAAGLAGTPKANGHDYLLPDGSVYQLAKGSYHLVPDVPTAIAMGIAWNKLGLRTSVGPIGTPLTSILHSATPAPQKTRPPFMMANGKDYILPNGNVYQLVNGAYRQIPDLATANAMGIKWNTLGHRSSVSPIGKPLPSVFVTPPVTCAKTAAGLVPSNGKDVILPDGNVYQFANGSFHLVPDTQTANAMGIAWNTLMPRTSIGPIGTPVPNVCTG